LPAHTAHGKAQQKHHLLSGRLARELRKVRELGYAFEDEEGEIGFRCIGAPIFDSENRVVAAISIAGTTSQISNERVARLASLVKATAGQIFSRRGSTSEPTDAEDGAARHRSRK
jgi:DNA-binding IclR family transcriptional regulator